MVDHNSDEAKEFRRNRLLRVKPKAAPEMISESAFRSTYVEYYFVSREQKADLEENNQVMFCPACARELNSAMGKYRVLHISYEEDPLGNYPLIAVAKCQGCEWEEMIPVVKQELTDDERTLLRRFNNAQGRDSLRNGHMGSITGVSNAKMGTPNMVPDAWSSEVIRHMKEPLVLGHVSSMPRGQIKAQRVWTELDRYEQERRDVENAKRQLDVIEEIEKQQRQATQARAVGKSAMLAQAYGMGQTRLQDIQNQYNDALSRQMAQNLDHQMMQQMRAFDFSDDEISKIKKEPAVAAKAAHKVLIDRLKKAVGK